MMSKQQKREALKAKGWYTYYHEECWHPPGTVASNATFGFTTDEAYDDMNRRERNKEKSND